MPSLKNKHCTLCNKIVKLPHNCNDKAKATSDKLYNKTKRQNQEFYSGARWKNKRLVILNRDAGLCLNCLREGRTTIGNTVHHIIEINEDWELRYVDDNLETICDICHKKEHGNDTKSNSK